jgi:hypothetical protein
MNSEKSLPKNPVKKDTLKEGIQTLKFFNARIRKELKNREQGLNKPTLSSPL